MEKLHMNDAAFIVRARHVARRSASASAAASSGCCTWRSSRSASSASTTWTSSRRRRASSTTCYLTDGTMVRVENPAKLPPPEHIDRIEEPIVTMTIHVPTEYVGRGAGSLPGAARRAEGHPVRRRRPRHHDLRDALRRGALRLSRQAQERVPRLRVDGLRARSATAPTTS